jgi:hypothetical protein
MRVTLLSVVGVLPALPQALVASGRGASLSNALRRAADIYGLAGMHLLLPGAVHGAVGPHGVKHYGDLASNRYQRASASLGAGQPGAEAAPG